MKNPICNSFTAIKYVLILTILVFIGQHTFAQKNNIKLGFNHLGSTDIITMFDPSTSSDLFIAYERAIFPQLSASIGYSTYNKFESKDDIRKVSKSGFVGEIKYYFSTGDNSLNGIYVGTSIARTNDRLGTSRRVQGSGGSSDGLFGPTPSYTTTDYADSKGMSFGLKAGYQKTLFGFLNIDGGIGVVKHTSSQDKLNRSDINGVVGKVHLGLGVAF